MGAKLNLNRGSTFTQGVNGMNEFDEFCDATSTKKVNETNDLDKFLLKAYRCLASYKGKIKKYHDKKIDKCEFV